MAVQQYTQPVVIFVSGKSLMGRVSQGHEMFCHDSEIMGSNPSQVELGVHCLR